MYADSMPFIMVHIPSKSSAICAVLCVGRHPSTASALALKKPRESSFQLPSWLPSLILR